MAEKHLDIERNDRHEGDIELQKPCGLEEVNGCLEIHEVLHVLTPDDCPAWQVIIKTRLEWSGRWELTIPVRSSTSLTEPAPTRKRAGRGHRAYKASCNARIARI
jgi:hypothetical protein